LLERSKMNNKTPFYNNTDLLTNVTLVDDAHVCIGKNGGQK